MLEEVLQNRSVAAPVVAAATVAAVKKQKPVKVEEPEEIEEAEELDEVEDLAEDAEELDEVEELAEEVDDAEEVEELAEDVDELEDAEEVEELAEDAEELDELEDIDEVEELEDAGEELEVLDEYIDHAKADRDFLAALAPPPQEFIPSNETYFVSEKFAHVENLYAEKLCLGDEHPVYKVSPVPVDVFPMPQYEDLREQKTETSEDKIEDNAKEPEEEFIEEPVEELYEDVQSLLKEPEFTMTRFADNLDSEVPELEGAADPSSAPENTIIEKDGVYSIAENLEFTNIVQDPEFKELVDSIL